jgi:phosphoglycolate phosphatase-like HAD superfamily hydrolase
MRCDSSMSTSSSNASPLALDLDGTLLDAQPRQVEAMVASIELAGGTGAVNRDEFWDLKREGLATHEALVRLGVDAALAERAARHWAESIEDPRWLNLDRLLPGVPEVLAAHAEAGDRPLILTARQHEDRVRAQVASLGLLRWCAAVAVVSPLGAAEEKAAELVARGCRGLVGDTESDARAAEQAGVAFAAVTTGQRSKEFLRGHGLAAFDSLAEALRALSDQL